MHTTAIVREYGVRLQPFYCTTHHDLCGRVQGRGLRLHGSAAEPVLTTTCITATRSNSAGAESKLYSTPGG